MKDPRAILEANLHRAKQRTQPKTMKPVRGRFGRAAQVSTLVGGRQFAIACDGTIITFKCKREGHVYKLDFASKRRKLVQRLTPMATRFQYRWWTEEKGGCIGECPTCLKEHRKKLLKEGSY